MSDYQFSFVHRVEHQELMRLAEQERLAHQVVELRRERRRGRRRAPVVTLAPTVPGDLGELAHWVRSERALVQWAGHTFRWPLTPDQLQVLVSADAGPSGTWTAWSAGRRVGVATLDRHHSARVAELHRVLVAGHQATTIATAVVRRFVSAAFEPVRTEVVRLCLDARDDERRTVYEQVGFRPFLVQANDSAPTERSGLGSPGWQRVVEMAMERPGPAAA